VYERPQCVDGRDLECLCYSSLFESMPYHLFVVGLMSRDSSQRFGVELRT
jgi:hypothetical protein